MSYFKPKGKYDKAQQVLLYGRAAVTRMVGFFMTMSGLRHAQIDCANFNSARLIEKWHREDEEAEEAFLSNPNSWYYIPEEEGPKGQNKA